MVSNHDVELHNEEEELLELINEQYQDMVRGNMMYPEENCVSLNYDIQLPHGGISSKLDLVDQDGSMYRNPKRYTGRRNG